MQKILLLSFILFGSTVSFGQYIANTTSSSGNKADLKHDGAIILGSATVETPGSNPLQIKYTALDKGFSIPFKNGSGGFELAVAGTQWAYSPHSFAGDGILRIMSGKNMLFGYGSTVKPTDMPGKNGVQRYIFADNIDGKTMSVYNTGKVTIGTDMYDTSGYRLFVKDGIKTERLKVEVASTNQWADHVFEETYDLMPLSDVATFINENKHLPNILSAQQVVEEGGVEQGEMNAKLLEKIEELTLYLIEQNIKIETLMNEVELLKK